MFNIIENYLEDIYCKEKKQSHAAFLFSGKKLIAVGYNQYNRHSLNGKYITSLHAEVDCLLKVF